MLIRAEKSCLVVIDAQERLGVQSRELMGLIGRISALIQGATALGIPTLATEHCPEKLGPTVKMLRDLLAPHSIHPKTSFAFPEEAGWPARLGPYKGRAFFLAGCEAHVCVYQSAAALRDQGHQVRVIADAVGSIRASDREIALDHLRSAGIELASTEMTLFEWLGSADRPELKDILSLVRGMR